MKSSFKLILPPKTSQVGRCQRGRYRKMGWVETSKLTERYVTEERLNTLSTMNCPFCMERYYRSFYDVREGSYRKALEDGEEKTKFWSDYNEMKKSGETPETYFSRGIIEQEEPVKIWWSKEEWFKKSYTCTTCGAVYESKPYRKDKYIKL